MEKFDMNDEIKSLIDIFNYKPYDTRIIVKEIEIEKIGAIFIPEHSRKDGEMKTNEGYVIAKGDGVSEFTNKGDIVLYARYSGAWQEINGIRYRVMNEEDILAKRLVYEN